MVEFSLVSRIADDKNFFVDLIYAVHQVRMRHDRVVKLNFIGALHTKPIYYTLLQLIKVLRLGEQVYFSKASISFDEMSEQVKNGYFINYSIGHFIGYASIEAVRLKMKTLFYNVDDRYEDVMDPSWKCFCPNFDALVDLMNKISSDEESYKNIIYSENEALLAKYFLSDSESELLKSVLT